MQIIIEKTLEPEINNNDYSSECTYGDAFYTIFFEIINCGSKIIQEAPTDSNVRLFCTKLSVDILCP